MAFGRSILLAAARSRTLNDFALRSAFVKRATRTFMPGEHADDALDAGAAIATSGRAVIFTQLGEAIASAEAAVLVRDHYLRLFDQIRAMALSAQVSVKPTQLGLDDRPRIESTSTWSTARCDAASGCLAFHRSSVRIMLEMPVYARLGSTRSRTSVTVASPRSQSTLITSSSRWVR